MAEFGVPEIDVDDSVMLAKVMELKEKLQTQMDRITDTDDYSAETIVQALKTMYVLKNLKIREKVRTLMEEDDVVVPDEFRCPISGKIMSDPVLLSIEKTYDRTFIEKWLRNCSPTCPQTKKLLESAVLIPNDMVWKLISDWCDKFRIERPAPVPNIHEEVITNSDRDRYNSLLEKIYSSSIPDQKAAAKEFRLLSKHQPIRTFFGESCDNITRLLSPLTLGSVSSDPDLHEDLITTVLNVSIPDGNKKLMAQNCVVLPLLIESLESGTLAARTNAAAAIFTFSALDSNKELFGNAGTVKLLIGLLEDVEPLGNKKVVAKAIFELCLLPENKTGAIRDGAVNMLLSKIKAGIAIDECMSILSILSSEGDAVVQMYELGAIPCVFKILRESKCELVQENCIMIISAIFFHNESYEDDVIEEEWAYSTLDYLAAHGTGRVRSKAATIVESIYP